MGPVGCKKLGLPTSSFKDVNCSKFIISDLTRIITLQEITMWLMFLHCTFASLCAAPLLSESLGWQHLRSLGMRPRTTAFPSAHSVGRFNGSCGTASSPHCFSQAALVTGDRGKRKRGENRAKTQPTPLTTTVVKHILPLHPFPLSLSLQLLATHPLPIKHI